MDYETVVTITQVTAMLFFIALFLGIVIYVFWPGNKKKFDEASRLPFENDDADIENGRG